jgi:hypothetical protein
MRVATNHGSVTAILVGCVKTKLDKPAKARDLYCSPLWRHDVAEVGRTSSRRARTTQGSGPQP